MTGTPNIERHGIILKANVPSDIFVKDGINYFEHMFYLRYQASAFCKKITVALQDANGQRIEQNIELTKDGSVSFKFNTEQDIGPNFGFLQLKVYYLPVKINCNCNTPKPASTWFVSLTKDIW